MAQHDNTVASTPNRMVGYAFGAIYLLVGLLGFTITGGVDFIARDSDKLLLGLFEINPLHNLVHIGIGVALLGAAKTGEYAAKAVNMAVGGTYALVGVLGLFILNSEANILSLNGVDNVLHFGSAAVLLGASLAGSRRTVAAV